MEYKEIDRPFVNSCRRVKMKKDMKEEFLCDSSKLCMSEKIEKVREVQPDVQGRSR